MRPVARALVISAESSAKAAVAAASPATAEIGADPIEPLVLGKMLFVSNPPSRDGRYSGLAGVSRLRLAIIMPPFVTTTLRNQG